MDIESILISGHVERFHAAPGITKQKVSEHSWGVALLCQHFNPDCSKALILAALTHDCAELVMGDMPASFKMDNPEVRPILTAYEKRIEKEWCIEFQLPDEELQLLKLCDAIEGMKYCLFRLRHGEYYAKRVFYRWYEYVKKSFSLTSFQLRMVEDLRLDVEQIT